jgi:hypothetical protein
LSSRPNAITDTRRWFARNGLVLAADRVPGSSTDDVPLHPLPRGTPTSFRGDRLILSLRQPSGRLLVFGSDFASGRYLVARRGGATRYALDFSNYAYAPRPVPADRPYVYQSPTWASEVGGVLYVSHAHTTFARSSRGLNAYVTALDPDTGKVGWRSRALVANSATFAVTADAIVTGYGFSREPDFLYVLDRGTGAIVQRVPVPSNPEYVLRKGNRLYVRTYDHDLVLRIGRG